MNKYVIGYLGGSITEGAGASKPDNSYVSLVSKWFASNVAEVITINAGIGGTGSDLGVFRLENDLLCKNPDIIFVEFAVNDYKLNSELCKNSIEGIVRKILKKSKEIKIIFIYTLSKIMCDEYYCNNALPQSIINHQEIANYYNIKSINVGKALYEYINNNNLSEIDFLPDNVHPNDEGHKFYANYIINELQYLFKPLNDLCYEKANLISSSQFTNENWKLSKDSMLRHLDNYIYSNIMGAKIKFEFYGKLVGIYWSIENDSGNIQYSIDNNPFCEIVCWDEYATRFKRVNYKILASELEEKKHTLIIKISENKHDKSKGNYIRIGAFLVLAKK